MMESGKQMRRRAIGIIAVASLWGARAWAGPMLRVVAEPGQAAPGTGGPFLNTSNVIINNAGDVAFRSFAYPSSGTADGIWSTAPGTLTLLTRTDAIAPGTGGQQFVQLSGLNEMNLDDAGDVGFRGQINNATAGPWGVWIGRPTSLRNIMLEGSPPPDTPSGFTYGFPSPPALNSSGHTAFFAQLTGPSPSPTVDNSGIWSDVSGTMHLVARAYGSASGIPGATFADFTSPSLNNEGQVAFGAGYLPAPNSNALESGLWVGSNGSFAPIYRSGMIAPGTGGKVFDSFLDPALNDAGRLAFMSYLRGVDPAHSKGYWSNATGTLQLIAREGDPAPGAPGLTFHALDRFRISSSGRVAFLATAMSGNGVDQYGLWAGLPGQARLVALSGRQVPFLPAGTTFVGFGAAIDLNASGLLVFAAQYRLPDATFGQALFADDSGGNLIPLLRSDETVSGRHIQQLDLPGFTGGDASGFSRYLNNSGRIAFSLGFTDNTVGVYTLAVPPAGDVSQDGVVNFTDLLVLAQHYGAIDATYEQGDLNGDGRVDFADLLVLAQHFDQSAAGPAAASSVPEPDVGGIAATSILLVGRRSRKRRSTRARPDGAT